MGLPPKVLQTGVTDMVRISDARMSGTAYGTAVLHVAPEAAAGGPLALVRDGDMIELDVDARRLHLDVSDAELAARRAAWTPPPPVVPPGGYAQLYIEHVQQADQGADLDFLVGCRGPRRHARVALSCCCQLPAPASGTRGGSEKRKRMLHRSADKNDTSGGQLVAGSWKLSRINETSSLRICRAGKARPARLVRHHPRSLGRRP